MDPKATDLAKSQSITSSQDSRKSKGCPFSSEPRDSDDAISCSRNSAHSTPKDVASTQRLSTRPSNEAGRQKPTAPSAAPDPAFEVDFEDGDTANPRNWSTWYRGCIILMMGYASTCVVMASSLYTSGIPGMVSEWGISETEGVLGVTTYLLGLACGPVVLAPLSEMYGRRPVYQAALALFVIFMVPCAVAQNIGTILAVRFLGAFCATATISNAPGTLNDVADDEYRALAFSVWSIGPMNGPVLGPIVGGFVFQYLGWRWTDWVIVIMGGLACVFVLIAPETYAPAILRKRAQKRRRETGDDRYWTRYDSKQDFWPLLRENMSRPFLMFFTEPICVFWDIYVALVYGILYLCLVAYPIVFTDLRGWSYSLSGLAFLGIGVGCTITLVAEPLFRRMINRHKRDPETGRPYPEAMVSVICIAAILIPTGEIWFAWTSRPNVFWIWPILAGIPFGLGNVAVFIYSTNYLVQSYGIYAASAMAGNTVIRSIVGATLPLAGNALYARLGPNWAGTLLGLLEAACIPIPFVFYRYGHRIRQRSALIRSMQEDKRRTEARQGSTAGQNMRQTEAQKHGRAATVTAAAADDENCIDNKEWV